MSPFRPALVILPALAFPSPAHAHVKWFSDFSYGDRPLALSEVLTPAFYALAALSVVVVAALVFIDRRLESAEWYERVARRLSGYSDQSMLIMRIGAGAVLLLSWQADAMLVPELGIGAAWVGWYQFLLAVLLVFPRTVRLAGAGLVLLYGYGVLRFGALHMLDYLVYAGAGYFLMVSGAFDSRVHASRIPALYLSVGFSLCWVALEKVVYPQWGLYLLQEHPQLAMGFDLRFFLLATAFVEFSLGYLLIINLLQRPMALAITAVFFTTTLVFGKTEVIGHTLIHAALAVFVVEGPGERFRPPIALHERLWLRSAFAGVNLALLLALLLVPYARAATRRYEAEAASGAENGPPSREFPHARGAGAGAAPHLRFDRPPTDRTHPPAHLPRVPITVRASGSRVSVADRSMLRGVDDEQAFRTVQLAERASFPA